MACGFLLLMMLAALPLSGSTAVLDEHLLLDDPLQVGTASSSEVYGKFVLLSNYIEGAAAYAQRTRGFPIRLPADAAPSHMHTHTHTHTHTHSTLGTLTHKGAQRATRPHTPTRCCGY